MNMEEIRFRCLEMAAGEFINSPGNWISFAEKLLYFVEHSIEMPTTQVQDY